MRKKSATTVVKVIRALSSDGQPMPAVVHARNRKPVRQYLSPAARDALGGDLFGYFEAEKTGDLWS